LVDYGKCPSQSLLGVLKMKTIYGLITCAVVIGIMSVVTTQISITAGALILVAFTGLACAVAVRQ